MDTHFVVTEHGCINLKGLSIEQRARALIGLAHADFREELLRQIRVTNDEQTKKRLLEEHQALQKEAVPQAAMAVQPQSLDRGRRMSPFPRPDYAALLRYDPERVPVRLELSDNTNLWGTHPAALAVH